MYHISSHIIRIGKLGVNSWVNAVYPVLVINPIPAWDADASFAVWISEV